MDHDIDADDEEVLRFYLELNELEHVRVRLNEYAPLDELKRLLRNDEVALPYRATLGLVGWLRYTILPDRLLGGLPVIGGGDHFNPYSNSVNVFSGDRAILLHELGHAKEYAGTRLKGTLFGAARLLPGVDLMQEANASTDAIRFLYCIGDTEGELRAYSTLIPAYSTYLGGYVPGGTGTAITLVFGHAAGRAQAWRRAQEIQSGKATPLGWVQPEYCEQPMGDEVPPGPS